MRKILILAYYFPPLGMGGTQRPAKFVKYLPQFGWIPYVVTVKDVAYYAKDPTLLEDIKFTKIYRTGSLDPQRLLSKLSFKKSKAEFNNHVFTKKKWQKFNKIVTWILIPDSKLLWIPFAFLQALKLIKKESINCLLTTSPPHSIHLAGLLLKRLAGISWTADFRDGWSGGNFQYEPTIFHKWINRQLEKIVLTKADRVISVSQKLVEYFKYKVPVQESKFLVLTNGFDYEDISNFKDLHRNNKFTVTFCGAMTSITPLNSFLESLSHLFKNHPDLRDEILVKLIGIDWDGNAKETIHQFELDGVVRLLGYVCHREALKEILRADLLLYPIAVWASDDFIPGKTFEYLASGNPILIVGPEVEGAGILKQTTEVVITSHDDLAVIEQTVLKYFYLFKQKSIKKLHKNEILFYERKHLTNRLAKILDDLV
ncbi:MAG: glycosyltransferase [bacterium]